MSVMVVGQGVGTATVDLGTSFCWPSWQSTTLLTTSTTVLGHEGNDGRQYRETREPAQVERSVTPRPPQPTPGLLLPLPDVDVRVDAASKLQAEFEAGTEARINPHLSLNCSKTRRLPRYRTRNPS